MHAVLIVTLAFLLFATEAPAQDALLGEPAGGGEVTVDMIDASGASVGTVTLRPAAGSGVLLRAELEGLPPGVHGFHIHQTGRCEPPDFGSAGGHYAPDGRGHGSLHPDGRHAGDLPNLQVPESGRLSVELFLDRVTLEPGAHGSLRDEDGSAVVVHERADDYRSQPAGDAGVRIACGVVR